MDELIEVKNKTNAFLVELKKTESFQLYQKERKKLDNDSALKEKIAELRKLQAFLGLKKDQGIPVEEDLRNQVMELYADITISETGFYYLLRERQVMQLLYQIFDQLEIGLELDFSGLEK